MIKRLNNITHKSLEKSDLMDAFLSIQVSLDGFSFSIYHYKSKKYLAFFQYDLKLVTKTPENLLESIKTIYEENILLQQEYKKVVVVHQNNLAAIVPRKYFKKDHLKTYLNQTVKTLKNDFITYDKLKETNANSVYIPFVNINNYLFTKFGEFEFYHNSTILADRLILKFEDHKNPKLFINIYGHHFDLIILDKGKLIFYNSFYFKTTADFIYYILYTMEQLNLDPEKINTLLLGEIEKNTALFKISYKYIRNIDFYKTENPALTSVFKPISSHANYNILNLF